MLRRLVINFWLSVMGGMLGECFIPSILIPSISSHLISSFDDANSSTLLLHLVFRRIHTLSCTRSSGIYGLTTFQSRPLACVAGP